MPSLSGRISPRVKQTRFSSGKIHETLKDKIKKSYLYFIETPLGLCSFIS
jgi:hypothetical protein